MERWERIRDRSQIIVGSVLGVAGIVVLVVYLLQPTPPQDGITWDTADRIQPGMSPEQAEQIVGERWQARYGARSIDASMPPDWSVLMWSGHQCDILVFLDQTHHVAQVQCYPPRRH